MTARRTAVRAVAVLAAGCAAVLLQAGAASAHPLGNFTVNRYDGLVAAPGLLRVDHVEDLAEIPATQAAADIRRRGLADWARGRCEQAAAGSRVTVGGRAVPLAVDRSGARLGPGQAGLHTLRVECRLTAALPEGRELDVGFRGAGSAGGPGWREITARGDRMTLAKSDVPGTSVSRELTRYPQDLLSSPADTTTASLRVRPGGPPLADSSGGDTHAVSVLPRGADRFTRALGSLVARHRLTPGFAALALLLAVVLGAGHALAPGHGKTLMAATAAARGGRARPRDVLPLAASVTVTHTLGVVALGLLVTAGSAAVPSVIAWLGVASGVLVMGAGAALVRRALRRRGHAHDHPHHHPHEHPHGHGHGHGHDHGHPHGHLHGHDHHPQGPEGRTRGHDPGNRPHGHQEHAHGHGDRPHLHEDRAHGREDRAQARGERADGEQRARVPGIRGTLLLGFAGGMVPSPSAVVVLVGAAALGQAWFGLLLVAAYGAGLALTLTAAGIAVVRLGGGLSRLLERRPRWSAHPVAALVRRAAPLGAACAVVALGAGLVLRGAASALG
ncbi:sulfite exporter TauE/SafE family protein [Streptomyces sp. MS06]|uniref:urease accessory protein UreH domain-containing protein n=1 Tax=Streptomyces sp. MS06 TaxID=3385974 RepID=UPI0039A092A6